MPIRSVRDPRFAVVAFQLRKDNQGNRRLFRFYAEEYLLEDARKIYEKRLKAGVYLHGYLVRLETMEEIESFGDPEIEENWLDAPASKYDVCDRHGWPKRFGPKPNRDNLHVNNGG